MVDGEGTGSGKGLSTELVVEKVLLRSRVSLVVGEELPELLDISAELSGGRVAGDKGVGVHGAVEAIPEVPVHAVDVDGAGGLADGLDAAKLSEPDHELKVAAVGDVVGVRSSEEIVGNVGVDTLVVVVPADGGGHAANVADESALGDINTGVGV